MSQPLLKLVEPDESRLAVLVREFAAKAQAKAEADRLELEASLAPIVDEIELALSIEHGELEELRQLVKLREAAAHQHAIRIGKLLLQAKGKIPHGQFQDWVKRNFSGKAATEYMRIARTSKRRAGRMNYAILADFERAQVEEALNGDDPGTPEEREAAKRAFASLTQSLRPVLKRRF